MEGKGYPGGRRGLHSGSRIGSGGRLPVKFGVDRGHRRSSLVGRKSIGKADVVD